MVTFFDGFETSVDPVRIKFCHLKLQNQFEVLQKEGLYPVSLMGKRNSDR